MTFSNNSLYDNLHKKNILGKTYIKEVSFNNRPLYSVNIEYFVDGLKYLSSGFDFDFEEAYLKALMEAVEWRSISDYTKEKMINGNYIDIKNSVDPTMFSIVNAQEADTDTKHQFSFNKNYVFKWTKTFSMKDEKEIFVPAQLIYSKYKFEKGEKTIRVPISTGSAAGFSDDFCIVKGILEIIERDNFTLHWVSKLSPKVIDYTDNNEISSLISLFKNNAKANIFLLDFSYNSPPYVIGTLLLNTATRIVSLGLGCNFNFKKTVEHSLLEAYKLFESQKYLSEKTASNKDALDLTDLRSIFLFNRNTWIKDKPIHKLNFLLDGKIVSSKYYQKKKTTSTLKQKKKLLLNLIMKKYDYDIYFKKYRSLNKKVIVTKTLIPQMLPLYLSEKLPFKLTKRLRKFFIDNGIKEKIGSIIGPPFF